MSIKQPFHLLPKLGTKKEKKQIDLLLSEAKTLQTTLGEKTFKGLIILL